MRPLQLLGSLRSPQLFYAQVREDPEVDQRALAITPKDRVLVVTSGGCTALTLLAEGPQALVAVDVNPTQNYLLELKLTAIRAFPLRVCLRLFGVQASRDRWNLYQTLSPQLSPPARGFWDVRRPLVERGLLYAGTTEAMVRWLRVLLFRFVHHPTIVRQFLHQRNLTDQARFYHEVWNTKRWRHVVQLAFHPWLFRLIYGRAFTERRDTGVRGGAEQNFTRAWIQKIERAFTEIPAGSNYFLSQLLWGSYLPGEGGIPPYLRPGIFDRVRVHADRIRWMTADLQMFLAGVPAGHFTKMTLSNAIEWIPAVRIRPSFAAVARGLAIGGRLVLRHLLGVTPVPPDLPLEEQQNLSGQLTREERAFLYTRVSLYERTSAIFEI
ncbi:MAG: DUF3419 family protein [Elusimicrobia bacterium]|nr:DUF3419 family protein [Elusimicrobiota bacterium]